MNTALVIMAAGIGSRFGGGIKQLEPVGPNGEIIMDYSIHDAIAAGFNKIIFIIRKDIEEDFREVIGNRIEEVAKKYDVEIAYAFQDLKALPEGIECPEGRTKPWGTGQAVLACDGLINEPFAVINADDYYGKEAFVQIHDFLLDYTPEKPDHLAMAGFILKNTLSDNGGVTRGICAVNEEGYLTDVEETKNIEKTSTGARVGDKEIDPNVNVSMNFWGLTPAETRTGIKIVSLNLMLDNPTDPVVWRGSLISNTVTQFWTDVYWGELDYLFVDMPPGTGDVPLTVFQSLPVDGIITVSSPQELVSMVVEKSVNMAQMMNIPILGLVENMSYYICPDCGNKHYLFGESHIDEIAKKFNISTVCRLPMDPAITKVVDAGLIETITQMELMPIVNELMKED